MDNEKIIFATDYQVQSIVLYSLISNDGIDITNLMEELNIFDSIFSTSVSGNIIIRDSIGLIEKLPLAGNETLSVLLIKPGTDGEEKIEKVFKIYKLSERKPITNLSEVYTLHFCSFTQLFSEQTKLSRSYVYKTYSTIVENILTEELQIPSKKIYTSPSIGNVNVTIPNLAPLDACRWISKRSLGTGAAPSFLFFENISDGYIFASLDYLYEKFDTTLGYSHTIQTAPNTVKSDNVFGVNYSELDQGFNVLSSIKQGVYSSTHLGIDFSTLSFEKTEFNASKYASTAFLLNGLSKVNKTQFVSLDGSKATDKFLSNLKVTPLTKNQPLSKYIMSKDKTVFSNQMDQIILQRQHVFQNLLNNKVYLSVPGLMGLNSGRSIKIDFLERGQREKNDLDELDDLYSGKYIITSSRHVFTPDGVYRTFMECSTDSYGTTNNKSGGGSSITIGTITGEFDYNA
jgi:hypothetical protein